jgi:hypothetical protein
MPIYDEAPTSGAMYPRAGMQNLSRGDPAHATILIPPNVLAVIKPRVPMLNGTQGQARSMGIGAPPASAGTTPFAATVHTPRSVAEVIEDVSPISNVQTLASEIRQGGDRPLLPPGFAQRLTATRSAVADVEPQGLRKAQAAWAAGVARWRSRRPSSRRDRVQRT